MDSVTAWLANYLLFVMAVVAVAVWLLREDRRTKPISAAIAVVGLVITLGLLVIAAHLHTDPRPFVQNPALHPLIKHSADNGFPSDHSAAAGLIAALVIVRHRALGVLLAGAAVVVAVTRVAAHVHHVQDVVAGLAIGVLAAWIATVLVSRFVARRGAHSSVNPAATAASSTTDS